MLNIATVKSLSRVRLFVTPWTVANQDPPSMGFSRQEYWSGYCHFLLQGILPTQGFNPGLPHYRQTLYCLSHQGRPNITNYQGKENQNHPDLTTGQNGYREKEHKYQVLVRLWRKESPGTRLMGM